MMRQTDPQVVGEWMLEGRKVFPTLSFHEIADKIPWDHMDEVDKTMTMGKVAAMQYQAELKERAEAGDKYAQAMLDE